MYIGQSNRYSNTVTKRNILMRIYVDQMYSHDSKSTTKHYFNLWKYIKGSNCPYGRVWRHFLGIVQFIWCRQPKGKGDNTVNAPFSPDKVGLALQIWLSNQEEVSQNDSGKKLINDKWPYKITAVKFQYVVIIFFGKM